MNYRMRSIMDKVFHCLFAFFVFCYGCTASEYHRNSTLISFTQPMYDGTVKEKAVSSIVETDVMMGMWLTEYTRNVHYELVNANGVFQAIRRISGNFIFLELRATSVSKPCEIQVRATCYNQETFCTVRVHVADVNDFQPLFPTFPYSVSVSEGTEIGTVITHVKATDSDRDAENTRFYYSLPEVTGDYFAVHPTTGAVSLTAKLNAKNQATHSVIIQATDRKAALAGLAHPKQTRLTVSVRSVNAHTPRISISDPLSYDSTAGFESENNKIIYAFLEVSDADSGLDGEVQMPSIIHCDIPGLFAVEPRISRNEYQLVFTRLPKPTNGLVNVVIEASDRGSPSRTVRKIVHVKFFDKKSLIPSFSDNSFSFNVSEISPVFTQVGFVQSEVSGNQQPYGIQYSIINGNKDGRFFINQNTALITTAKRLDQNTKKVYNLTVAAENVYSVDFVARNITYVSIFVQDANDHDPQFKEEDYHANISENAPIGTVLVHVQATDRDSGINGTVFYSLIDASGLPFAIDPFNGTIYTTGKLDSDVFSRSSFRLHVRASDVGVPFSRKSESFVIVHIVNTNDNPPVFNEINCVVLIPATTTKNTKVLQLDPIDIDLNPVTCQLLAGGDGWFDIKSTTCELRLAADITNTEAGRLYTLLVTAFDGKHTSTPAAVNISIENQLTSIKKTCVNTGAIERFEKSMNNLQSSFSHLYDKATTRKVNKTSQLPNKHKPTLLSQSSDLIVAVREDTKLQTVLTRIRARDADSGYNGKLWFTITAGNDESCFAINTQNGIISLVRSLDRERKSLYNVTVKISDLGKPSKSTVARLKFMVIDVNDNNPVFRHSVYSFQIPENVSIGYRIQSKIEAYDIDENENAEVRYRFSHHQYDHDYFSIDPITGYINVTKGLDRETIPSFNFTVVATDSSPLSSRSSTAVVLINLIDINDNAPEFHQTLYKIRVSEDLPENAVIFWLQAHDRDEGINSVVRYTLTDGAANRDDGLARFDVDARTGVIRLSSRLNARIQNRYNITARARDSKKLYSTCYIEVEVIPVNRNLHAPYFPYRDTKIEVQENAAVNTVVDTLTAFDEDTTLPESDIGYYIVDGTGIGIFAIDEKTGAITTMKTLDRESEQYYWLTVVAEDRADIPRSSHVFVLVEVTDVNDNSPQSLEPMYFASIEENSQIGSFVTQIQAFDKDTKSSSNITFRMDVNDFFEIDSHTGIITTAVKKRKLDREVLKINDLSFDVIITDGGSPQLSSSVRVVVELTDINDNAPVFFSPLETKLYLPERSKTKQPAELARVVAFDKDAGVNGSINYVIDYSRKFTINSKTGIISTTKPFTSRQKNVLKITAIDLGQNEKQSKLRLEINWRPVLEKTLHAPIFDDRDDALQEGCYFEHSNVQYTTNDMYFNRNILLLRASDLDSTRLWFSLTEGNTDAMFDINTDNVLYVAGEPDAENINLYNLTVQVTDGYNKAQKQIEIPICDINDHPPVFSQKTFAASISENSPADSEVLRLAVSDGDRTRKNRNFIFKIRDSVNPNSKGKFRISHGGVIYTTVELDRETQREHVLHVEVNDQGSPRALQAFCYVIISITDQNEHAPQFTSSTYYGQVLVNHGAVQVGVDETSYRAAVRVRAIDRDHGENARIFYSIQSGNSNGFWKINPSNGEILPAKLSSLNGSTSLRSTLIVKATDGGRPALSSTCQVTIDVQMKNAVVPRFKSQRLTVELSENAAVESFVTMVTATASSGLTYSIDRGNEEKHFSINRYSGVISLSASLDREQRNNYSLNVVCISTEGDQATVRVDITVLDINDNRPYFPVSDYFGVVHESATFLASTSVIDERNLPLVISALDKDMGNNAKINYKIIDPSDIISQTFSIDPSTGSILVNSGVNQFDYETRNQYEFQVECFDLGSPQLHSVVPAHVTIFVRDANDSVLSFEKSRYVIDLLLPTAQGVIVSNRIKASFNGFRKNHRFLTYSITEGNKRSGFAIDPNNGVISVVDAVALTAGDNFNLGLHVTDGKRSAVAIVEISIRNISDQFSLSFSKNIFEVSMAENSTQIRTLIVTHVSNVDLEDNLRFSILNPSPGFEIMPTSGLVKTTGVPVDREKNSVFELLVEAISINHNDILPRGRCIVRVHVTDVNDIAPQFIKPLYHAALLVDAQLTSKVKQVEAIDRDIGINGLVNYSLDGRHSGMFNIDSNSGLITLKHRPNKQAVGGNTKFNVTLVARDNGDPMLFGYSVLIVSVINRATPVFTKQFYGDLTVTEDALPHVVVTDSVKASNPDGTDIIYSIESGDSLQKFDIDYSTGTITTRKTLDHELESRYRLRIRARDAQSPAYADVEVEILVVDLNDNYPVFTRPAYVASLSESASVGTTVTKVQAVDADSNENGRLSYQILDDDGANGQYFHIDQDTGVIWTARKLDHELNNLLSFVVRASDHGSPIRHTDVSVTLTVTDINDNPPVFEKSSYRFEISFLAKVNQFVGVVSAWDADSSDQFKLSYFFKDISVESLLAIDFRTGLISLTANASSSIYTNVSVSDGVYTSTVGLVVEVLNDENDLKSVSFKKAIYRFSVMENEPPGLTIGRVAASGSDRLIYSIESDSVMSDAFSIDRRTGRLHTVDEIDREEAHTYSNNKNITIIEFTITAVDSRGAVARCKVLVQVFDKNDNAPMFVQSKYGAILSPNNKLKDSVLNVTARDFDEGENGRISYTWYETSMNSRSYFTLDIDTGEISIRDPHLPFGTTDVLQLFIQAIDHGEEQLNRSVAVSIYLATDQQSVPRFKNSSIHVTLNEDAAVGSEVATVHASTDNNRQIIYEIADAYSLDSTSESTVATDTPSNVNSKFVIDPASGLITTVSTFDREMQEHHVIIVLAYVKTTPELITSSQVLVSVGDVNDNSPVFSSSTYHGSVVENSPNPTFILQIEASDLDQNEFGKITYSLDTNFPFSIDSKTGILNTKATLNREEHSSYNLIVEASDKDSLDGTNRSRTSTCHVIVNVVDVNDRPPTFSQNSYEAVISESASIGQIIPDLIFVTDEDFQSSSNIRVYIIDGDSKQQFELVSSDQSIDANSLTAGIKVTKELDREAVSAYTLTLLVTDGRHINTAKLHIRIGDVNDNYPVCEKLNYYVSLEEDTPANHPVLRVQSFDADVGANGKISFELRGKEANLFRINPITGEIFIVGAFDRETTSSYKFTALAVDGDGKSCQSQIFILVNDINDEPPRLEPASLKGAARENTPVDSLIHRVTAEDNDQGTNGSFVFSLTNDADGQFSIEPQSGIIVLRKPLDREKVPSYQLEVKVQDQSAFNRLSSTALLFLKVLDINDNPPIFTQDQYETAVREDTSPGRVIAQVTAESLDTGANALLFYDITRGNEREKFEINRTSGEVWLVATLDYEADQNYVLKISATDHSENPLASESTVRINVTDVNDNRPQFALPNYKVSLSEDTLVGHVVTSVSATDPDIGDGGNITYHFAPSNDLKTPFHIDQITGTLRISSPGLDYEEQTEHELTIVATDHGVPPLKSETRVQIIVTDVNDNRPMFQLRAPVEDENFDVSCTSNGSNCSLYIHEGSDSSVIQGLLMLDASDADGEENSEPFDFEIVDGNADGLFYIDHENILKTRRRLQLTDDDDVGGSKIRKLTYYLQIKALDSGTPLPLSSDPNLSLYIVVLKENQYPPTMTSQHVQIVVNDEQFSGCLTSKLFASDRDPFDQDRIRFSLANPIDFEQFFIDPLTGAITTQSPLPIGNRNISVRVSDGSHSTFSTVSITVIQIGQTALKNSVSIAFSGISNLADYLSHHHAVFEQKLKNALPDGFKPSRDMFVMSLQLQDGHIVLLFAIRMPPGSTSTHEFYSSKSLRGFLEKSRALLLEEDSEIQVEWIDGTDCTMENCNGTCSQVPLLRSFTSNPDQPTLPIITDTFSLVTPAFSRTETCVCPLGKIGKNCQSVCSETNNQCSRNKICVVDEQESRGFSCRSPVPINTVLGFSGRGFIQYKLDSFLQTDPLRISMRLRTYQSNSTIFFTESQKQHFSRLETINGQLRFTFDCGSGSQTMMQNLNPVSHGRWCQVDIESRRNKESNSCGFKLTIDGNFVASAKAPEGGPRLDVSNITFGGLLVPHKAKRSVELRTSTQNQILSQGFRGCLREIFFNKEPLVIDEKDGIPFITKGNVKNECQTSLIDMGACRDSPCLNGGLCVPLSDGSHECKCPLSYDGEHCQIRDPCGAFPCKNKGYCYSDGQENIRCHCRPNFTGERCEISLCEGTGLCYNDGKCVIVNGRSSCLCKPGWNGANCDIDSIKCLEKCGNENNCYKSVDGYVCNCSSTDADAKDLACRPSSTSVNFGTVKYLLIGISCVIIIVVILIGACVVKKQRNNLKNDNQQHQTPPPRIPRRPAEYQRSSRNSFMDNSDQRNPRVGMVLPQVPSVSPTNTALSDNDSIQKPPWPEYDPAQYNASASSSVHRFPSRKTSSQTISEQQGFYWDDSGLKTEGSNGPSSMASPVYQRSDRSRVSRRPDSPASYRSIDSTSTFRSRNSKKSNALSGHYNSGKTRRAKQIIHLINAGKVMRADEQIELEECLPEIFSNVLAKNSNRCHSKSNSLKSNSRLQPGFHPTQSPYPSSSHCASYSQGNSRSASEDEYQMEEDVVDFDNYSRGSRYPAGGHVVEETAPLDSGSELPSPSNYQPDLIHGHEDFDNILNSSQLPPSTANKSYSSLLNAPYNPEIPSPAAARSYPFHPSRYLLKYIPDDGIASENEYDHNVSFSEPRDLSQSNSVKSYITPQPPQRKDSERLAMSSLSEEEEEEDSELLRKSKIHRNIPVLTERPPIDPKRKSKQGHYHSGKRRYKQENSYKLHSANDNATRALLSNGNTVL